MNFMIYGEDCRHAVLSALLLDAGFTMQAPADLLILSPKERFSAHTEVLKEHGFLWGGLANDTPALLCAGYQKLAQSDAFRKKNSIYTAEGALAIAISEVKTALCESAVYVLGYGYLGKECARLFSAAGATVTVYTENPEERMQAAACGYPVFKLTELTLPEGTLLLNTIPFPILDSLPLYVNKEAVLIELASTPCITKELPGLRILPAGALPSRFCPHSAAKLMFDEIMYQLKKE